MENDDKARKGHLYKIWWHKLKVLYRRSDRFFHLLVGMPSYDKYLEHMRIHHPD
ncbi:CstA-like transporter-associated (seleno)protein, partial [Helicobacter japonicus]